MSSQRPKKLKASRGRGSITLPPELAAHYLRNAVNSASSSSGTNNSNNDDEEMKALMSMFVEIMGMTPDEGGPKNGMSFSFSSGSPSSSSSSTQWPPTAAAAAAAAASGMFSSDGQWSFDYYDEDEDDDEAEEEEEDVSVPDLKKEENEDQGMPLIEENVAENDADAMARQIAEDELAAEEERAKKAAKRREKKQRKKEKAKQEAALKAQVAEEKKRSKQIQSWRSRIVAACQSNEDYKIQGLLAESPLGKQNDEDVTVHLEFLLPHCLAKSSRNEGDQACQKLASYVITMSVSVAFTIGRNGRSALHTACFVGDCYFVKLATDKSDEDSPLDLLCKDSGWTPLHYAVAAGSQEAMEELLIVGCDYDTCTDESLTCRASNGEGITARELAEIIASGKQDDEIETQGAALEETMERYASSRSEKKSYLRILRSMAERLKDVEENGYEPPKPVVSNSPEAEDDEDVKPRSSSIREEAKKKKKKKKKQVKREQSEVSTATASSVPSNPTSVDAPVEKKEDPLVTALLGMGFTEEQIHEAAKACGGMERATADQLVMWILGGGEESSSSPAPARAEASDTTSAETGFVPTTRSNAKATPAGKSAQQPVGNLKRAQQTNVEAVKREEEAHVVTERLAAKREEQRRRNREWNNRAQARQKEEMEQRAQEEAMRIAKERATALRQAAAAPVQAGKASAQARAAQAPAPTQILQRPSHMPVGGIPAGMMQSHVRPYAAGAPATAAEPNMMGYSGQGYGEYEGMAQYMSSGNSVSSAGSGRQHAPAQYVSSGNSVSSAGSGMVGHHAMAAQYVSSGNSISSVGSGILSAGMMPQTHQQMYGYPTSSVPPPGFQSFGGAPAASSGSSNLSMSEDMAVSYEENGSGEIRATARSFVPTGFKPAPAPSPAATAPPSPAPPGMGLSSTTQQTQSALSNDDPLASLLSAAASGTAPSGIAQASPALTSTTEEPSLNSVLGFDLNGSSNGSSLLGSLSLPSTNNGVDDTSGSSLWGGSSLAPGPTSLPGFGAADPSKPGDAGVGTSRLGSIW